MEKSPSQEELRYLLFQRMMEEDEAFAECCCDLRDAVLRWANSLRRHGLTSEESHAQWVDLFNRFANEEKAMMLMESLPLEDFD